MLAFRQLEEVEDELRGKVAAEADKEERRRVAAETAAELKRGYTYVGICRCTHMCSCLYINPEDVCCVCCVEYTDNTGASI